MNSPGSPWTSAASSELAARTTRLMAYSLAAIVLMALDYRGHYVEQVRSAAALVVEPVVLTIEAPFGFSRRLSEEVRGRQELQARVAALEHALRNQRAELMLLAEVSSENEELRSLLEASQRLEVDFQAAELMSIDLNPYSHRVVINRGRRDGLVASQPVIDSDGVIGQVDRVALHSAQVILISDPDHALPVRVQRTNLRTVAYGTGTINALRLTDLPMNVDLETGDLLITSGLGGAFPPGLPVAEIETVSRRSGEPFARADARPLGRLDRARHVLVVALGPERPGEELDDALDMEGVLDEPAAGIEGESEESGAGEESSE